MSHSHLSVRHLLNQLEDGSKSRTKTRTPPAWLMEFIELAAEQFEPVEATARAGYACHCYDGTWTVALYLGETEWVGGSADGSTYLMNFTFDIDGLYGLFDAVDHIHWHASPQPEGDDSQPMSAIVINGFVADQPLCVEVHMTPLKTAGPGFRRFPDGRCVLA